MNTEEAKYYVGKIKESLLFVEIEIGVLDRVSNKISGVNKEEIEESMEILKEACVDITNIVDNINENVLKHLPIGSFEPKDEDYGGKNEYISC